MLEQETPTLDWLLQALIPSVPPTLTAIVGFYVFHRLAVRRQKREEVRQLCQKFKEIIQDLSGTVEESWKKSGDSAVRDGNIALYKGQIFQADLLVQSIITYESKFSSIKTKYREFKRHIDEENAEDGRFSIEARNRGPREEYSFYCRRSAQKILGEIDRKFVDIYR